MDKAFAEVEEQEIPCTTTQDRMISPLIYTSQCVDRSIYACKFLVVLADFDICGILTFLIHFHADGQVIERALTNFKTHLVATNAGNG